MADSSRGRGRYRYRGRRESLGIRYRPRYRLRPRLQKAVTMRIADFASASSLGNGKQTTENTKGTERGTRSCVIAGWRPRMPAHGDRGTPERAGQDGDGSVLRAPAFGYGGAAIKFAATVVLRRRECSESNALGLTGAGLFEGAAGDSGPSALSRGLALSAPTPGLCPVWLDSGWRLRTRRR
jgi:hypothetical protein